MSHDVAFSKNAAEQIRKLDGFTRRMLYGWIDKQLDGIDDPRSLGGPLTGDAKGLWRYRVGNYRIISHIEDDGLVILVVQAGHRSRIHDR
ncbi:MAG: type II toxin-antitoxin system RelE/ParE family toxin [Thermoplasmatales archaeon]|nr:type II toxin-antitoxin system RelE/ParE family toxin [Thermoplasmatales archaeon]